jgi:hypothetical protein
MSRRLRNISLAFGVSIGMWAVIIHGSLSVYAAIAGSPAESIRTASLK